MKRLLVLLCTSLVLLVGCEDTDVGLVAEAGLDAIKAVTLSDEEVESLAVQAARHADMRNTLATPENPYNRRLRRLVGEHLEEDGVRFNFKVYLTPQVNAFAMGDGTIRIYSGLMDMMNDGELRFVIGHEMGHVVKKHVLKKMRMAYASSAIRKGIASQNTIAGTIARSQLGGFAQLVINAQFSQQEEREADDYGLTFLQEKGYNPADAVAALRKLASLGKDHSFLSSHPAPEERAERLATRLASTRHLQGDHGRQSVGRGERGGPPGAVILLPGKGITGNMKMYS